jgi:hypothetical protein
MGHKIDPDRFNYGLKIYQGIGLVLKPDCARTKKGSTVTVRTTTTILPGGAGVSAPLAGSAYAVTHRTACRRRALNSKPVGLRVR